MSTVGNWRGPNIIKDGLVLYIDPSSPNSFFNKTSTTIKDISGNGGNGTLINFGSQTIYDSNNGGSIIFDGTDDGVVYPLSTSIQSINVTNQLTLSCFIKINFISQYRDIVGINKLSGGNPFVFRIHENNQYFFDSDIGDIRRLVYYSGTSNDILNQWVQLSATIGDDMVCIYKNGVKINSLSVSGNIKTLDSNFGSLPDLGYGPFSGNISQILLYNKKLSDSEILQNYNILKSRFETSGSGILPTTFVSTWYISTASTITLPLVSSGNYNFTVNWGDGSSDVITSHTATTKTHSYSSGGAKTISIDGTIQGWSFNNGGDKSKITSVTQWGNLRLGNNGGYFYGCNNLNLSGVTDTLNLSGTTDLTHMFRNCSSLTTVNNINNWDVSKVLYMNYMFFITNFNQDLSNWNVSGVTDMSGLFSNSSSFNNGGSSNINNWNVANVLNMTNMFANTSFNQPLSGWNVSKVTNMIGMFIGTPFNQPINNWNVSGVTSMSNMFLNNSSFNQPLSGWNVSGVYQMNGMFNNATNFNQDLGNWNVANVLNMTNMFANTSLSTTNYNDLLTGWTGWIGGTSTKSVQSNVPFSVGSTKYTSGSTANDARNYLVTGKTWTITDGGGI